MSSNRLMYDTCAYKKRLDESVGPLNYTLYPGKYENCSKCRIELGTVGGNNVSLFSGNLVDLERIRYKQKLVYVHLNIINLDVILAKEIQMVFHVI